MKNVKTSEVIYTFGFVCMLLADLVAVPFALYSLNAFYDPEMWAYRLVCLVIALIIVACNYGVFCFIKGFSIIVEHCDKKKM